MEILRMIIHFNNLIKHKKKNSYQYFHVQVTKQIILCCHKEGVLSTCQVSYIIVDV